MTKQLHLFPMPAPKRIELTPTQREVLAWIEWSEGLYTAWPRRFQTATLRRLIDKELVKVIAYGPARYRITALGRMVRQRYARGERHGPEASLAGQVTRVFIRDSLDD